MTDLSSSAKKPADVQKKASANATVAKKNSARTAAGKKGTQKPASKSGLKKFVLRLKEALYSQTLQPADVSMRQTFLATIGVVILIAGIFAFVFGNKRADLLFASHSGKLTPIQYVDTPSISNEAVINWAMAAFMDIKNFNFNNIDERFNSAYRYFTPEGWDSFVAALYKSGIIDAIKTNKQYVSAVPGGAPIMQSETDDPGHYSWVVQIPYQMTTVWRDSNGTNREKTDSKVATITVESIPTNTSLAGYPFGISRINE